MTVTQSSYMTDEWVEGHICHGREKITFRPYHSALCSMCPPMSESPNIAVPIEEKDRLIKFLESIKIQL